MFDTHISPFVYVCSAATDNTHLVPHVKTVPLCPPLVVVVFLRVRSEDRGQTLVSYLRTKTRDSKKQTSMNLSLHREFDEETLRKFSFVSEGGKRRLIYQTNISTFEK